MPRTDDRSADDLLITLDSITAFPLRQDVHTPDLQAFRYLAAGVALAVAAVIVVPRFAPVILLSVAGAVALVSLFLHARSHGLRRTAGVPDPIVQSAAAAAAWVLIACLWSAAPAEGAFKAAVFVAVLFVLFATASRLGRTPEPQLAAIVHGIAIGAATGALYIAFETLTTNGILRFIYTQFPILLGGDEKHVRFHDGVAAAISSAYISRATAVYSLFLCPAILASTLAFQGRTRVALLAALAAASAAILLFSRHQTSQVATITTLATLGLALLSTVSVRRLLMIAWCAIFALVVPLSLAAAKADLHLAPWLFKSARARIIIWNYTAERTLERPLLGVGTNATRTIHNARGEIAIPEGFVVAPETRAHAHNVFLQIWYELGAIGAVLFGAFGLFVLAGTRRLDPAAQAFALAQFAATMTMVATTYGLWQTWFQAVIMFSALALLAGAALVQRRGARQEETLQ